MGLSYKTGCLIEAIKTFKVDVAAHQANCYNTMNSGIAKAFKVNFPEVYAADCETGKGDPEKFGYFSFAHLEDYPVTVLNLYGQFRFGADRQYTNYEKLEEALEAMAEFLQDEEPNLRIGIPKLGCGRGGGNWYVVEALVEKYLGKWDVTVYSLERGE